MVCHHRHCFHFARTRPSVILLDFKNCYQAIKHFQLSKCSREDGTTTAKKSGHSSDIPHQTPRPACTSIINYLMESGKQAPCSETDNAGDSTHSLAPPRPDLDLFSGVLCLEHQERALRHLLHTPHAPQDVLQLIKTAGNALEPGLCAQGKSDGGRSDGSTQRAEPECSGMREGVMWEGDPQAMTGPKKRRGKPAAWAINILYRYMHRAGADPLHQFPPSASPSPGTGP